MRTRKKSLGDLLVDMFGGLFIICCSVIMVAFTIYAIRYMFS